MSHLIYHDQLLTNQALTTTVIISAAAVSSYKQSALIYPISKINGPHQTRATKDRGLQIVYLFRIYSVHDH